MDHEDLKIRQDKLISWGIRKDNKLPESVEEQLQTTEDGEEPSIFFCALLYLGAFLLVNVLSYFGAMLLIWLTYK